MRMAYYSSLPKAGDDAINTPASSPIKRWTAVEKSPSSISQVVATSIISAKTTMGTKARSIIPKIVHLTPAKKKNGGTVVDEASTPVLFCPDYDTIRKQPSSSMSTLVDPFSSEVRVTSPSTGGRQLSWDDFNF